MRGIAQRRTWLSAIRARYAQRHPVAPGASAMTLLRPLCPLQAFSPRPVVMHIHAGLQLRLANQAAQGVVERLRTCRDMTYWRPGAPAMSVPALPQPARPTPHVSVLEPRPNAIPGRFVAGRQTVARPVHATAHPVPMTVPTAVTYTLSRQTVERIRDISRRDERRDQPAIQVRTVLPKAASVPPASGPPAAFTWRDPGQPHSAGQPWTTSAAATPDLPIDAIADKVIGQIDRRLTAYRERMGRV